MKTLAKYHGAFVAVKAGGNWNVDPVTDGWTQSGTDPNSFTSEVYFDLAGMSMEEKTILFEGATVQQCGFTAVGAAAGDNVLIFDIMTSVPVDITSNSIQADIVQRGLGFPNSSLDYEHVIFQRMQRCSRDLDYANMFPVLAETHQSGSLMATASDRIYSYRLLLFEFAGDGAALMPPVRHLLSVKAVEEPDHTYIMRLLRSYELQQEPDVD